MEEAWEFNVEWIEDTCELRWPDDIICEPVALVPLERLLDFRDDAKEVFKLECDNDAWLRRVEDNGWLDCWDEKIEVTGAEDLDLEIAFDVPGVLIRLEEECTVERGDTLDWGVLEICEESLEDPCTLVERAESCLEDLDAEVRRIEEWVMEDPDFVWGPLVPCLEFETEKGALLDLTLELGTENRADDFRDEETRGDEMEWPLDRVDARDVNDLFEWVLFRGADEILIDERMPVCRLDGIEECIEDRILLDEVDRTEMDEDILLTRLEGVELRAEEILCWLLLEWAEFDLEVVITLLFRPDTLFPEDLAKLALLVGSEEFGLSEGRLELTWFVETDFSDDELLLNAEDLIDLLILERTVEGLKEALLLGVIEEWDTLDDAMLLDLILLAEVDDAFPVDGVEVDCETGLEEEMLEGLRTEYFDDTASEERLIDDLEVGAAEKWDENLVEKIFNEEFAEIFPDEWDENEWIEDFLEETFAVVLIDDFADVSRDEWADVSWPRDEDSIDMLEEWDVMIDDFEETFLDE